MKRTQIKKVIIILVTLLLNVSAYAILVEVDYYEKGDKLITRDTETGLDWLDLSLTTEMSYLDVIQELSTNGNFSGFRYATMKEAEMLQVSAGLFSGKLFESLPFLLNPMQELMKKVGITRILLDDNFYSYGQTSEEFEMAGDDYLKGWFFGYSEQPICIHSGQFVSTTSNSSSTIGSWLVQKSPSEDYIKSIPEPSTLLLIIFGLLSFVQLKRSNKIFKVTG